MKRVSTIAVVALALGIGLIFAYAGSDNLPQPAFGQMKLPPKVPLSNITTGGVTGNISTQIPAVNNTLAGASTPTATVNSSK
jgi:hypothetical protein